MSKLSPPTKYIERVLPGATFFLAALFVPIGLFLIALPFSELVSMYVSLLSYFSLVVFSYCTAPKIQITSDWLAVGNARIPLSKLGTVESIPADSQFSAKGQDLNPLSFRKFQVGVKGLVRISIQDPNDPTPYWLIATRHPEVLVRTLQAKS
ncbi:MAG: DUF3093 domain-containing protein [Micrococcales bacterium]|nr:DUF3093 domain-containing protein [Micrococcales bacterium]